ncbi:hypothetical protein B0H13DRAFT_2460908 [Mycena leptocephala]|nr:hypothetical protein B0H13DRAFT_2460908 [Mycena leptocephala]
MTSLILQYSAASLLFCATALAVTPIVASTTSYGSLVNAGLNRDSCTSSFWTTNVVRVPQDPSVANTASFSPLPSDPSNPQPLVLSSPQGFGSPYYSLEPDECPPLGLCGDGTRWHLSGLSVLNTPSYSLYHVISQNSGPIPSTTMDISSFWSSTQIGYGSAASVVNNGFAYLYGATPDRKLAVARAALTGFLGSLEDKGIYEYYVNNCEVSHRAAAWTTTAPTASDPGVPLPNTSSIQGTIYWSPKWESYVWIGGDTFPDANFYISTAPNPEAHPSLTDGTGDYIFITWTKTRPSANGDMYDAPLVRVDWQ